MRTSCCVRPGRACVFRSTGRVTVHKFAAGHRYLSYVRPRSDEQRVLLQSLDRLDDGHVER
jgi:hypothetical protein